MCGIDCHSYLVVFSTFMVCFLTVGVAYGNAAVYYNYWLDHFRDKKSLTSLIGSANIGLILVLGPLASLLANRYGHRIVVCTGGILSSLALFGASFATSVPYLLVSFIVCGIGWCLAFIPGAMGVSFYWKSKYHGVVFGLTIGGIGVGQFVTPMLIEALTEAYSWRGSLIVQSGLNLNLIVCGAMLFPVDGMKKKSNFLELNLLKDWFFLNTCVYWVFCHMGISVASVHIAYVVKRALHANYQQAAYLTSLFGISGACARIGHACLSKLPGVNVLLHQMVCMSMMGCCLISMPYVSTYPVMIIVIIITGVGMGSLSLNSILTIDLVGLKSRTAGYGFFATSAGMGLALGAPIAGLLSDFTNGNYPISLYFGGGVQLFSCLVEMYPLIRWRYVKSRHEEDIAHLQDTEESQKLNESIEHVELKATTA